MFAFTIGDAAAMVKRVHTQSLTGSEECRSFEQDRRTTLRMWDCENTDECMERERERLIGTTRKGNCRKGCKMSTTDQV
jgi:hypothetical protein